MKVLILLLLCLPCLVKADVQLVKNGKAAASIVIPAVRQSLAEWNVLIYRTDLFK